MSQAESSWYCVARRWLLEHLGIFSTHPATSRRIADIQNGCRSCCKLENLRDAMSMEDFIILIRVTSAARVVINTWVCMFHDLSSILYMVPRLEVIYHCA